MINKDTYQFSSESVTEGHPDKVCDQIADAILDELLTREAALEADGFVDENGAACVQNVRCAVEALVTKGLCMLAGEVRTQAFVDVQKIARSVIRDIGYVGTDLGFDADTCGILNHIHGQSPDIAMGVDKAFELKGEGDGASVSKELTPANADNQVNNLDKTGTNSNDANLDKIGAGDQGIIFGYACDETKTYMPMAINLAHRLSERLTAVRKSGELEYLRPDGKTQVTLRYENGVPVAVDSLVLSTQHTADITIEQLRHDVRVKIINPVLSEWDMPLSDNADVYINPTGRFVVGGPAGDTGVTGRKIIVDTYGGAGHHGGGAFSGKDATKVDRSASYAARWIAKNVVAAGLAHRCEVQIAYAIGVANPVGVYIDTFGSSEVEESRIRNAVVRTFDMRPAAIQRDLKLWRPIYRKTSNYGHFGRELPEFEWEKTNRTSELKNFV